MRVREVGDDADFLRSVNRAVLGCLCDRDRPWLDMMLVADVVQMRTNPRDGNLPVWGGHREQFAANVLLRRAALGSVEVRRLRTDDGLVRSHHALEAKNIGRSPAENQEHFRIAADFVGYPGKRVAGVWIGTIGGNVTLIRGGHRRENLRVHPCPIVAREGAPRLLLVVHAPTITRGNL